MSSLRSNSCDCSNKSDGLVSALHSWYDRLWVTGTKITASHRGDHHLREYVVVATSSRMTIGPLICSVIIKSRYIPPSGKQNSRSCRASVRASVQALVRVSVRVRCRFRLVGFFGWRFGSVGFGSGGSGRSGSGRSDFRISYFRYRVRLVQRGSADNSSSKRATCPVVGTVLWRYTV